MKRKTRPGAAHPVYNPETERFQRRPPYGERSNVERRRPRANRGAGGARAER